MNLPKKRVLAPALCATYLGFYVPFAIILNKLKSRRRMI